MTSKKSTSLIPDLELVQKISTGDEIAFSELYICYNLPIFNFLVRLTHDTNAAEDLLQEVFLAVWQGSNKFLGKSSVKTWIFRIAYHQAISWLRKNKKTNRIHQNIDELPLTSNQSSPESTLIQHWQEAQIRLAIEKLSHNHRSVIELTFVHGFSYQEIADIMECPVGTVKSRMSYALRYLKTDISINHKNEF